MTQASLRKQQTTKSRPWLGLVRRLLLLGAMTQPRPVEPGGVSVVSRRTAQRQFLLTPSAVVNDTFEYCLGIAARRHGVKVHAYVVMSNHYHIVLTDVEGRLPSFMEWLNGKIAKALNCHYGRCENFWSSDPYSRVDLLDREAVYRMFVYTLANPVKAGLVKRASDWPGAKSRTLRQGRQVVVTKRPSYYFREKNSLEEQSSFDVSKPGDFCDMTYDEFGKSLEDALRFEEEEAAVLRREKGRRVVGAKVILSQSPYDLPKTAACRGQLNPRVAAGCKQLRSDKLKALARWIDAYKEALEEFMAGARDVIFPAGTYLMRVRYAVRCALPP